MENTIVNETSNNWHSKSLDEVYAELKTSEKGLANSEIASRQSQYGLNELQQKKKRTF
jgi:magnesium-transporting ATPase (P-type)